MSVPAHDDARRLLRETRGQDLGLVLTGGGARGAYQVGVLSWIADHHPELYLPIITGVSAGAVNAAHLAAHHGTFAQSVAELRGLWSELTVDQVFRVDTGTLALSVGRWALRLLSGGRFRGRQVRSLLDTTPLRRYLEEVYAALDGELTGVEYNLRRGFVRAAAITTTNYSTGQSAVWVQGRQIEAWTRPMRRSVQTRLRVEHVMASTALPFFFPAIRIGPHWHGDGGIRQTAPISPALHLGARRVLAISTRYGTTQEEGDRTKIAGYPPPAQVAGVLLNSIFLDMIDQDELRLSRLNRLLLLLDAEQRDGLHPISLLVMRPSQDLATIAGEYEPDLPKAFRFLMRGLGTRETVSPDVLSMLMFQPEYLRHLMRLGREDAESRGDELHAFIEQAATGADVEVEVRRQEAAKSAAEIEMKPEQESAAARDHHAGPA
ncbi:MAG: patatin-like phospholipase family protein [Longimicrobiales bacterium]